MKNKIFTALAVMVLVSLFRMPVLAGSINVDEQRIIAAISAVYEFDGAYYKVTDAYIAKVTDYLSSDGIELSSSEVDDYLNQFYANIAVGISSGYMECVGKVAEEKEPEKPKTEEDKEQNEDQNEAGQGEGSESDSNNNNENNSGAEVEDVTTEEATTISGEESGIVIEGAIKVTDLGVEETSGDNTRGSMISGVQEYTVAEMERQSMYVWDIEELTVHAEAYKDSEIIGTLLKGDEVVVTGAATTGWARIEYGEAIGYVSSAYLRTPGYMIENGYIEPETIEATQETVETEETTVAKDYSDAEPFQKGISLGVVAIIIAAVAVLTMAVIILVHRSKNYKRK